MKKSKLQILVLLALFLGNLPLSADPIELAKWTFETGYDVNENVYTPNDSPWAEVGAQWFNAGAPIFIANESVGTLSDYTITGKTSRYWQLCSGWNNHVFRVVNDTEANNISDFTDASQHNNYYELRFPTKGYKNVTIDLACAYGGNAEATMKAVYSIDGGNTWKEAGEYLCAGTWWTYNAGTLNIPAVNAKEVIVRLIYGNGFSSNWNLDYITISGDEFVANPNAISLPYDEPLDLNKATLVNGVIKTEGVEDPQFDSFRNPGSATFALNNTKDGAIYEISLGAATANAGNTLRLVITDDATGDVELDKTIDVANNGWQAFSTYKVTTTQMAEGEKTFVINFLSGGGYTSNVNNIVFNELEVGDLALLTTNVQPSGAGKVSTEPSNSVVVPGSDVTFTATPNRGYEFASWTDSEGNELSTENPFTYTVNGNTEITANFTEVEVVNIIPTDEEHPWAMENGELKGSRANFASDHHIDYMMNGDIATYKLDNQMNASYYDVNFTAGTQQDNVSLNFTITDAEGNEVCNQDVDIENNCNWDASSKSYTLRTKEMLQGKYTMIITFNSVGGNGTTANVNNITFTGKEKFVAETVDNQTATITFPFNQGVEGQVGTYSEGAERWFKTNYTEHGNGLILKDVNSGQTRYQPITSNEGSANDGNAICFYMIPKAGLTFTPTSVSFNTTRYGTDGGKIDVTWVNSDLTTLSIATEVIPARNNATPNVTAFSEEIMDAKASDGLCGLRLNLYSLGNTKQVGFSDIIIEGVVNGTTQDAKQCKLVVSLSSDEAAKLTITPNSDVFDEGDEVTVSVADNFGYHFSAWTDGEGNEVSTENPYSFNITDDTELIATFTKNNTYALNIKLTEGARDNLVQISPEGTMIDGKR
ncbi:MAG: hypothetical protein IIT63_05815, partial [Prevotella sp.]|nr:hypothetical protein [Prevotella sp.]